MRTMNRRRILAARRAPARLAIGATLLVGLVTASSGCHSLPVPRRWSRVPYQKDVVRFHVELPRAVAPTGYRELAAELLRSELTGPAHPDYPAVPLYEAQVLFHDGEHHLASVLFRLQEGARGGAAPPLRHEQTIVEERGMPGGEGR